MSALLRLCAGCNLNLALIVVLVQTAILANYKHLKNSTYSFQTGIGIWTGIVLAINGSCTLLIAKRKFVWDSAKMYMAGFLISAGCLLAGILMTGLAAGAFYGLLSKFVTITPHNQSASKMSELEHQLTTLKILEGTLFGCGIASIFTNAITIVFLHTDKKISSLEESVMSNIIELEQLCI